MKKRGSFWVILGFGLIVLGIWVGWSAYNWWDLPLYLLGLGCVMAGVWRMDDAGNQELKIKNSMDPCLRRNDGVMR